MVCYPDVSCLIVENTQLEESETKKMEKELEALRVQRTATLEKEALAKKVHMYVCRFVVRKNERIYMCMYMRIYIYIYIYIYTRQSREVDAHRRSYV